MNSAAASPCPPPSPRYYHTLFTHSLPKALRTLADETPTCVDVLMNFLVAAVTKLPPIKVPYGKQHQEARSLSVRMEEDRPAQLWEGWGRKGRVPSYPLIQILCCGGRGRGEFGRTENPATLLLFLGAWGPGACA